MVEHLDLAFCGPCANGWSVSFPKRRSSFGPSFLPIV
jgi:hypothetical protein